MKFLLLLIIIVHIFVLYNLIFFPYPEFFIYPYLTNNGLIPYKQIFDQHFPGLMFLPVNFNNLGFLAPEIARVWSAGIIVVIHILLFFITSKILKNPSNAIISNLFFLTWQPFLEGWVLWIDNFLPLFFLPAFYFIYQNSKNAKNSYLLWAGVFLGIALIFKQVVLPLAGLVFLYLLFSTRKLKPAIFYLAGFLPLPLLMTAYFYFLGALKDLWYWSIWFNVTTFAQYGRKGATIPGLIRVIFIYSPLLLLRTFKETKLKIILLIFTVGSLASATSRFDFVHFQPSLPFIAIIFAIMFDEFRKHKLFLSGLLVYIFCSGFLLLNFYKGHISESILFFDEKTYQMSDKIESLTEEGEEIFIFGASPHLYFMSNTLPAGKIFVFQFPWFMMETENLLIKSLKEEKPNLILRDGSVEIEGSKITDYAKTIDQYILDNYTEIERIETTQFMIRN